MKMQKIWNVFLSSQYAQYICISLAPLDMVYFMQQMHKGIWILLSKSFFVFLVLAATYDIKCMQYALCPISVCATCTFGKWIPESASYRRSPVRAHTVHTHTHTHVQYEYLRLQLGHRKRNKKKNLFVFFLLGVVWSFRFVYNGTTFNWITRSSDAAHVWIFFSVAGCCASVTSSKVGQQQQKKTKKKKNELPTSGQRCYIPDWPIGDYWVGKRRCVRHRHQGTTRE